ncbi:hypothetical protein ACGFNU_21395 [Spirillospora sp. NPDC048911]|uniref:hypothetical protein n=1 Tax=Spirillospora sp. NPDC048911 TaxID=3364527 RepID=UPI00371665FD
MMDTWGSRDEPILRAIVELADEGAPHIMPGQLVERTGMDATSVARALNALAREEPPFFQFEDVAELGADGTNILFVHGPTGHARRAVGAWPTPEKLADRIVEGLLREADATEDEEQAGRLRRTASWFGSAGRDILVNVIASGMGGG